MLEMNLLNTSSGLGLLDNWDTAWNTGECRVATERGPVLVTRQVGRAAEQGEAGANRCRRLVQLFIEPFKPEQLDGQTWRWK